MNHYQNQQHNSLKDKLSTYKSKYYLNLLMKGGIIASGILLSIYLIVSLLEYSIRFDTIFRAILFFTFIATGLIILARYIFMPGSRLFLKNRQLSNEEAARNIGSHFPVVKDKLLNIIQLEKYLSQNNALIKASIDQKSKDLGVVDFSEAIDFKANYKYLKISLIPFIIGLAIWIIYPSIFTESTKRIVQYKKDFVPQAPFQFVLLNEDLQGFKNEDFEIALDLEGAVEPDNVYMNVGERRIKLFKNNEGVYTHKFSKIQKDVDFKFDAAGFYSQNYELAVVNRPNIKNFNIYLNYPGYLNQENERLSNTGNFQIPQGTKVKWQFNTLESDSVSMVFTSNDEELSLPQIDDQLYELEKQLMESQNYQVRLRNKFGGNREKIYYHIDVIPDQYPEIDLDQFQDTTYYNYIILGGRISDDYGLRDLSLFYKAKKSNGNNDQESYKRIPLNIDRNKSSQSYYHQWWVDSLKLNPGEEVEYFLQVRDNDGINGSKATKTSIYTLKVPTRDEVKEQLEKSSENSRRQIDKSKEMAEKLNEQIEDVEERLKGKKELSWQDEKMLREIMEQKEQLAEEIEKLKEQYKSEIDKRERFNQLENPQMREKVEQLQELMQEVLDEETKKLYDELQKLLEEKSDINDIQEKLNDMSKNEKNLEKELERTLELFKRLKFEMKLDEVVEEMNEEVKEQEQLSEETEQKESDLQDMQEKQEELNQNFEETQEKIDELEQLNQDLKNPNPLQDNSEMEQEIQQNQQEIQENLQKGKRNKASESQQQNAKKMQQMAQQMQQMQQSMSMNMMQENLDHLRDIVDNLVKLSFDQEDLMKDFRKVNQSDPRFVELSQQQLKLKDDAKIIEDSLTSLAERVFQIKSFVTREVGSMNQYMEESMSALKERKKGQAIGKQQFSMTSMNNLALLLDDVLTQMQQAMAEAMGMPNQQSQKGKEGMPSLSELQKQLNNKIDELKKSGKSGRELSQELAKLAAEQERIRNMLKQQEEKTGQLGEKEGGEKGGSGTTGDVIEKMEETEVDLVNKQLTQKTIERQKQILTRLLEAEESLRERELDDEREGEQAQEYQREIPPAFEEYIKLKEQEIELLKTVPPKMNPYYKKEVNEYFRRLSKSTSK